MRATLGSSSLLIRVCCVNTSRVAPAQRGMLGYELLVAKGLQQTCDSFAREAGRYFKLEDGRVRLDQVEHKGVAWATHSADFSKMTPLPWE